MEDFFFFFGLKFNFLTHNAVFVDSNFETYITPVTKVTIKSLTAREIRHDLRRNRCFLKIIERLFAINNLYLITF